MLGSLRAYAKHRQVTLHSVQKAVAAGRIPLRSDGRLDFARADAAWTENTRAGNGSGPAPRSLAAAQRDLAQAKAELMELKLAKERGELLDAADVQRDAFACARAARDRMALVPSHVTPLLAPLLAPGHSPADVRKVLESELQAVCDDLGTTSTYTAPRKANGAHAGA